MNTIATILAVATAASAALAQGLTGDIRAAGSSTAGPVTTAVAEAFNDLHDDVRISITTNGTGGGFKKFVAGETDISNASRIIKPEELRAAQKNGIEFYELPIAFDGITVCVNKENTWADRLTVDQLHAIFRQGSDVAKWSDLDPNFPDIDITIHMPGTDSGTFDYFKENVLGEDADGNEVEARSTDGLVKVSVSEDDNLLINGIAGDRGAIGFFGCSYYFQNHDKVQAVAIQTDASSPAVLPTHDTIETGEYKPLSRPLFIYINAQAAKRPEIREFIRFYFADGPDLAEEIGYVKLPPRLNFTARQRYLRGYTGSVFYDHELELNEGPLAELYREDHKQRQKEAQGG